MLHLDPALNRAEMAAEIAALVAAMSVLEELEDRLDWLDRTGWLMPRDAIALGEMLCARDELVQDLICGTTEVAA